MRNEKQILNSQLSILNLIMEEITLNNGGRDSKAIRCNSCLWWIGWQICLKRN